MKHEVIAPSPGESITEVSIVKWFKQSGESVKTGEVLLEIESDKATVEVVAEGDGVLEILKQNGETIPVGEVMALIDSQGNVSARPAPSASYAATPDAAAQASSAPLRRPPSHALPPGPAVEKMAAEKNIHLDQVVGSGKGGRVTKSDLLNFNPHASQSAPPAPVRAPISSPVSAAISHGSGATVAHDKPGQRRVRMSKIRQKIAQTLKGAQENAAILTTFNEVDMTAVMQVRNSVKDAFKAKHGVTLSFMSFFTRACVEALKEIPEVNASIDGEDILYNDYQDIGIAVGTERGLVVPVIRDAGKMDFPDLEKAMANLAAKARDGKLSLSEMTGGTFTISNGGTYGSLLSTPILNPPQSGILGMHNIVSRPMAIDNQVVIRPMMYLALSYDHRLIDGKGAVTFLVKIRDLLQDPEKLNLNSLKNL